MGSTTCGGVQLMVVMAQGVMRSPLPTVAQGHKGTMPCAIKGLDEPWAQRHGLLQHQDKLE